MATQVTHYIWNTFYFVNKIDMEIAMAIYSGISAPPSISLEQYIALVKEKMPYRTIQMEEEED